jgi:hypothetical protein
VSRTRVGWLTVDASGLPSGLMIPAPDEAREQGRRGTDSHSNFATYGLADLASEMYGNSQIAFRGLQPVRLIDYSTAPHSPFLVESL